MNYRASTLCSTALASNAFLIVFRLESYEKNFNFNGLKQQSISSNKNFEMKVPSSAMYKDLTTSVQVFLINYCSYF